MIDFGIFISTSFHSARSIVFQLHVSSISHCWFVTSLSDFRDIIWPHKIFLCPTTSLLVKKLSLSTDTDNHNIRNDTTITKYIVVFQFILVFIIRKKKGKQRSLHHFHTLHQFILKRNVQSFKLIQTELVLDKWFFFLDILNRYY